MHRRDFIKLVACTALAPVLPALPVLPAPEKPHSWYLICRHTTTRDATGNGIVTTEHFKFPSYEERMEVLRRGGVLQTIHDEIVIDTETAGGYDFTKAYKHRRWLIPNGDVLEVYFDPNMELDLPSTFEGPVQSLSLWQL